MTTTTVEFTGWESDEFLSYALWLLDRGVAVRVEVIGREPILATPVQLRGVPVGGDWSGYRRVLTIRTDDGTIYEIGGSNASRPIASTTVRYTWVADDPPLGWDLDGLIGALGGSAQNAEVLPNLVRMDPQPATVLRGLLSWGIAQFDELSVPQLVAVIRIVGLLASIETVEFLTQCLRSGEPAVRRQAALRFRGMEHVFKAYPGSNQVMDAAIAELARCVAHDSDDEARIYAAEDLGYFQNPGAVEQLNRSLRADPVVDVRWSCAVALGRTTAPGLLATLLGAASRETEAAVTRGCLLGISRLIPEAAQARDREGIRAAADLAIEILSEVDRRRTLGDAAAALLGELARPGSFELLPPAWFGDAALDPLANGLSASDMPTRSASAYALGRYVGFGTVPPGILDRVRAAATPVSPEGPLPWPDSAYHQWYLAEMGELLSRLEAHGLAGEVFAEAASTSSARPWSSEYFSALELYERAESSLPDHADEAIRCFTESETVLSILLERLESAKEDEDTIGGLRLRHLLARSRALTLKGIVTALRAGPNLASWENAEAHFAQATELLGQIDVLGLGPSTTRRLSPSEGAVITGLMSVAQIGATACKFRQRSRATLDVANRALLMMDFESDLTDSIDTLRVHAGQSHSAGLRTLTAALTERAEPLIAACQNREPISTDLLRKLMRALGGALPRPGMCPLLASGHATMAVNADVPGDGTSLYPYAFVIGTTMVLDVTVAVSRRGRSETLKFTVLEPGPDSHGTQQFVPVHDNTFSLKPVVLGVGHRSQAPVPTVLRLTFQTEACSVVAHELTIYHHCVPPDHAEQPPSERIAMLRQQIEAQQQKLEDLAGEDDQVDVAGAIRFVEAQLSLYQSELANLLRSR